MLSIDIPELAEEERIKLNECIGSFNGCWSISVHRRKLFEEVEKMVADNTDGNHFSSGFIFWSNVPLQDACIERIGSCPEIYTGRFLDGLETTQCEGLSIATGEEEAVEHFLAGRITLIDEEIEPSLLG